MKKYLNYKIIIATAVAAVVIAGIFWVLRSSVTNKEEITLNNKSAPADDILSDSQPENKTEEIMPEPEKIQEKSEAETKKEPVAVESPKDTKNNSSSELGIIDKLMSSGFLKSSGRSIDTIVIHSSYDALGSDPFDVDGLIKEYGLYGVSAHYLIDRGGKIYRLVEEKNIAYHAGVSRVPDGRTNINEISIGIELMNTKEGSFTEKQYGALQKLVDYLKGRYEIKYVLGHDQIAPGRKDDPWNFDWKKID